MNLAQLIQSQNLARLLQALDASGELTAGTTVRAHLLSLDPDGTATAAIGDAKITLVLAGPQAKQAALQPGATLLPHLEAPEQQGGDPRATLQVEAGVEYQLLRGVMFECEARIHRDTDTVAALGTEIFQRYLDMPELDESVRAMIAGQAVKRVGLEFVERRRVSWNHRKLGGVY